MPLPYFQKISMLEKVRYRYLTGCMESTRTYRYKEKTWGKVNFYIVQVHPTTWHGVRSGVRLSGGRLDQDRYSHPACAQSPLLLGHLIVAAVKVLLTLGQPFLQEGGVAAAATQRAAWDSWS